eukprot:4333532-Prymnesium_polylepis.1
MELSSPTSPASASSKRGWSNSTASRCAGSSAGRTLPSPGSCASSHVGRRRTARTVGASCAGGVRERTAVKIP